MTADPLPQPDAGAPPLVSVCILSWNTRELVQRNLQTLYSHLAAFDFETIVVDNASQDNSADMVAEQFPQVLLLRQSTNLMFARGMNTAARAARGQFLLFLNSDCFITPETLGCMIEFMQGQPRAMLSGVRQVRADGSVDTSIKFCPGLERSLRRLFGLSAGWSARKLREGDRGGPIQAPMLAASCLLARRELVDEVGLFDEAFTLGVEDSDLSHRTRQAGHEVWFLPQCEVVHLHAQSRRQLSRADRERPMVEGAALFCRKHYSRPYRRLLSVLEALILGRDLLGRVLLTIATLGLSKRIRGSLGEFPLRWLLVSELWRE